MTHLLIPALALLAAHRAQTPPPLEYVVVTRLEAALLGGTAVQATALAKAPAFAEWTPLSASWAVSGRPPAGGVAPDAAAVQAAWDASPALSLRLADLGAGTIGTMPPADAGIPSLRLVGGDPSLGIQLRFRISKQGFACPAGQAAALVAAAYGPRRYPAVTVGRWDAALGCPVAWGAPVVSATWPKVP